MARELIAIALALSLGACGHGADKQVGDKPVGDKPAGDKPAVDHKVDTAIRSAAAPLASKSFYRVDAGPPTQCTIGDVCEAHLVLTALGDYHVNQEYPFKFVGEPASTTPVDGEGTFALDDEQHGTLTVKFRPAVPGTAKLVGTFKLSVCSSENCQIEKPRVELAVPVS